MKTYSGKITNLERNQIFVFGSNTQGRHGKGAALYAKERFGAKQGQPRGLQGKSYAIITKDLTKSIHPSIAKEFIVQQVKKLYEFASFYENLEFLVAYSATTTNLNGYTNDEMAQIFGTYSVPDNIVFEEEFAKLITKYKK